MFGIVGLLIIFVIIFVQEGQRRIPIQYANRVRGHRIYQGGSTFLPLRVNMAGVIPIIFAISILLFPYQIAQYFTASQVGWLHDLSTGIVSWLNPLGGLYLSLYFLLTFAFAFFYTFIVFKPDETADNLRKSGGFIPGIRPGQPTEEYLRRLPCGSRSRERSSWRPWPSCRWSSPRCPCSRTCPTPASGVAWAARASSSS